MTAWRRQARWWGPAAVVAVAVVGAVAQCSEPPVDLLSAAPPQPAGADPTVSAPAGVAAMPAADPLHALRMRLQRQGALADVQVAGDWCVAEAPGPPVLRPCPALRHRFDHYLLALGEAGRDELGRLVADEARRAHGAEVAGQVAALWERYLQLGEYRWSSSFSPADPATWAALLAEQRQVRRQTLGPEWAQAFYADEEQQFDAQRARVAAGAPAPADPGAPVPQLVPGTTAAAVAAERSARYGEAAARRLASLDEAWADWERRLAAARATWQQLQQAAHLSPLQRAAEMAAHLRAHFAPDERGRVEALLGLRGMGRS